MSDAISRKSDNNRYRITAVIMVETDIITSIAVSLIGGIVILVSVCVETFKTDVIVFVANFICVLGMKGLFQLMDIHEKKSRK